MLARMPLLPRVTASTSLGMGSDVITTSAPLVTSATDLAAVAPRSVQVLSAAAFRSNTVTWWLLRLTMLRHMGPPMLPTPMNPTFTVSSPGECDGRLYDRIRRAQCFALRRGEAIGMQDREDQPTDGAQQAASDSAPAAHAGAGQHAHGRRRRADPGPDAHRSRAGADLLARHDGHAAGRRVGRRPGGRTVRREALRQGGAWLAAPGAHAGRRCAVHRRDAGTELAEGA